MSNFFYDLNKKLNNIRETPEINHNQLNERDEGKPGKNFAKIAKDAGERYGSKAAGERVAGAVRNKLKAQGKLEEEGMSRAAKGYEKYGKQGMEALAKAGRDGKALDPVRKKYDKYDESTMADEGNAFGNAIQKAKADGIQPGEKVNVGGKQYPVKEEGGMPMTAKQKSFAKLAPPADKITFADKIAGAKKEVDEMLGDVAANAMKKAIGGGRGRNAEMDEENDFTAHKRPAVVQPKVGSVERGHKHDIKHTATGRMVTRRTDPQGISVGSETDDEGNQKEKRIKAGRPTGPVKAPERVTAKATKHKGGRKMADEDLDTDGVMMTQPSNMSSEGYDPGEYDQEGGMAKDDIKTIVRHAQALEKILGDDDNLPEWVQSKLAKIEGMMIAVDEYMQNQSDDGEEPIAEKAVSKKQQRFMGMVHAAQKGEKPSSKSVGKVARTMKKSDAKDFASTKQKGLPEKAPKKKKEVEESGTTSGSVAASTGTTKSKGGFSFGQGVYESLDQRYKQALNEGMSINISMDEQGHNTLNVTATDEDAQALAQLLKMAGLGGQGHGCPSCGQESCGCDQMVDENQPNWPTNTETSHNAMQYSGGLNGPKSTGQTTTPVLASQLRRQHSMEESVKLERSLFNTWKNYKG